MSLNTNCGFQKLTASGVVGTSGRPVCVYGCSLRSSAVDEGIADFYSGTSSSGTLVYSIGGTVDASVDVNYCNGRVFPGGLYVNLTNSPTYCTIWYQSL